MKNTESFEEGAFNPDEEVQKLWSIPIEQRRKAVSAFKGKLARQREAWALCRTSIEEQIKSDPDLPREEMVEIIGRFASSYGFAKPHIKIAEQLIDKYIAHHKRVTEIRKKYPDDIALINRLTGMRFVRTDAEDFKIQVGPISLEIFCSGFNAVRIYEKLKGSVKGYQSGCFASQSSGPRPIYFIVVNND